MATLFKSSFVRNFLGGFLFGAVLVFTIGGNDDAAARQNEAPSLEAAQTWMS
ncbi:hypothetical protein [Rhizorhapis sp. SPR117]|uniref:hypothetical protein n=1 Tax=Rhizorhapis sp. SPR117 TaxID=2912611 RepID=UPI001F23A5E6|nr:hypothetical protein [Rhizorhapis sp. SPR117]